MSFFVTFEGGDGSGKSTQAKLLYKRLKGFPNQKVFFAEEPGTTLLGKMLKKWLSDREQSLTLMPRNGEQLSLIESSGEYQVSDILLHAAAPRSELLAFTIARSQLVEEFIQPNLTNDSIVILVRYTDSTTAYQGYGRKLDLNLVEMANNIATKGIKPDLTILLDLDPKLGIKRKYKTRDKDHFEKQVMAFHESVRQGYLELAAKEPSRWLVVDATKDKAEVEQLIWKRVSRLIKRQRV